MSRMVFTDDFLRDWFCFWLCGLARIPLFPWGQLRRLQRISFAHTSVSRCCWGRWGLHECDFPVWSELPHDMVARPQGCLSWEVWPHCRSRCLPSTTSLHSRRSKVIWFQDKGTEVCKLLGRSVEIFLGNALCCEDRLSWGDSLCLLIHTVTWVSLTHSSTHVHQAITAPRLLTAFTCTCVFHVRRFTQAWRSMCDHFCLAYFSSVCLST